MNNPILVDLPKDTWAKVAEAVTIGQVSIVDSKPSQVLYTYRLTGDPVPDGVAEGVPLTRTTTKIINNVPIDVYLRAQNMNGTARVDI